MNPGLRRRLWRWSSSIPFWLLISTVLLLAFDLPESQFSVLSPCLDLRLQDCFYDPAQQSRFFFSRDHNDFWYQLLHEKVRHGFVPGVAILLFLAALLPRISWSRLGLLRVPHRTDLWLVILAISLTAVLVGLIKNATHVYCPYEVDRYGGKAPYVHLFEAYPEKYPAHWRFIIGGKKWNQDCSQWTGVERAECGRCFPCGHASGGFALMGLFFVFRAWRRWLGLGIGVICGSVMGVYQMMNGNHYFSHVVFTALLAWIICLLLHKHLPLIQKLLRHIISILPNKAVATS